MSRKIAWFIIILVVLAVIAGIVMAFMSTWNTLGAWPLVTAAGVLVIIWALATVFEKPGR